ncbi:MAG: VCBS repeat-containing protein, partial [Chloroflexi bacterium]|nr:VCBS repeat-containing protein [Chloroflexota bacterium]
MQVHIADLDHDGWLDIVALVQTYDDRPETMADSTRIFWGGPDGYSMERSTVLPTYSTGAGYLADLDQDGFVDLALLDRDGVLVIHHGGPDGFPSGRTTRVPLGTKAWALHLSAADLDGDGWPEVIVGVAGHYARSPETLIVLWGGPDGFDAGRATRYDASYSPGQPTVARLDTDEALTLVMPAYSSVASRELPWELLRFRGREIDHGATRRIQGYGSCHVLPIDLDGDGWTDLLVSNHRRNEVHDADAIIYWGGPDGIREDRTTHLPGWGPHYLTMRDPGNALDRGPAEHYVSQPIAIGGARVIGVEVDADIPDGTALEIELRVGHSRAGIQNAPWSTTPPPDGARLLQYRASFISRTGARSSRLRSVTFELG